MNSNFIMTNFSFFVFSLALLFSSTTAQDNTTSDAREMMGEECMLEMQSAVDCHVQVAGWIMQEFVKVAEMHMEQGAAKCLQQQIYPNSYDGGKPKPVQVRGRRKRQAPALISAKPITTKVQPTGGKSASAGLSSMLMNTDYGDYMAETFNQLLGGNNQASNPVRPMINSGPDGSMAEPDYPSPRPYPEYPAYPDYPSPEPLDQCMDDGSANWWEPYRTIPLNAQELLKQIEEYTQWMEYMEENEYPDYGNMNSTYDPNEFCQCGCDIEAENAIPVKSPLSRKDVDILVGLISKEKETMTDMSTQSLVATTMFSYQMLNSAGFKPKIANYPVLRDIDRQMMFNRMQSNIRNGHREYCSVLMNEVRDELEDVEEMAMQWQKEIVLNMSTSCPTWSMLSCVNDELKTVWMTHFMKDDVMAGLKSMKMECQAKKLSPDCRQRQLQAECECRKTAPFMQELKDRCGYSYIAHYNDDSSDVKKIAEMQEKLTLMSCDMDESIDGDMMKNIAYLSRMTGAGSPYNMNDQLVGGREECKGEQGGESGEDEVDNNWAGQMTKTVMNFVNMMKNKVMY